MWKGLVMARIDWVKAKLDNWARWHAQGTAHGLGYPRQSPFMRMARQMASGDVIPVNDLDASQVDAAVMSLKLTKSHLFLTLRYIYLDQLGVRGTAQRMGRAESTVKANLDQADHAIAAWFEERAAAARSARVSTKRVEGGFTT